MKPAVRVAVAYRLGCKACEPHTCPCGKAVDARGLHGSCCRVREWPKAEGRSNRLRYQQLKSPQSHTARWKTSRWHHIARPTLGTRQAHGMRRHSSWHLCWQLSRTLIRLTEKHAQLQTDSSEQDCKVWRALCLSHLFASDSWTPGTSPPSSWSKKLVDALLQSRRTQEKRCSCSRPYLLLFKRGNAVAFLATFDAVWYPVVVIVFV